MPVNDLDLLIGAAHEAGRIALRHWGKSPETWEKPGGAGPVTEADLEVDRTLADLLMGARPDYGWLSEETEDTARRIHCERTFIIDPIDGTRAFIKGEKGFSHSLAIAHDGVVESAVVYLPALDMIYTATRGGPALLNGATLTPSTPKGAEGRTALTNAAALQPEFWPGGVPNLQRAFRPSLAWRLCLVAEGEHDALITLRNAWEWDIAAGCLIAEAAGVRVTDRDGGPLRFNARPPQTAGVIAAPPDLHDELLSRRQAR